MTSYDLLKLFDDAWGIRSVVDDEIIWQNKNKIKLNIEKSIKKAIDINNILKSSTDSSSGLALMKLFTYDCLDYNTKDSIIYNNKLSRDFINGKRCVSYEIKSVTIILILFFDIYLLFSTMTYGLDRGLNWQLMWLFSIIIIIIIMDIIFKQTTEEVLLGFIIPNSIRMKILNVINLIKKSLYNINEDNKKIKKRKKKILKFSASDYLNPSTLLAHHLSSSWESKLILDNQSPLPAQSYHKMNNDRDINNDFSKCWHMIINLNFIGFLSIIKMMTKNSNILINFGTLPYLLQKLVIDIFVPIIIGGVGFVVLIFFSLDMLIQFFIMAIIFVIILIYTNYYHRHHQQQQQNNKIEPYINSQNNCNNQENKTDDVDNDDQSIDTGYAGDINDIGEKHGKGTYTFDSGDKYFGNFIHNKMEGYGVLNFVTGDSYEGQMKNDLFHGKGLYHFANGDVYDGYYLNGLYHGHGIFYHNDGNCYDGDWVDGKQNGYGVYVFANGDKYVGRFNNDMFNGHGIGFSAEGGEIYSGEWKNNEPIIN